VGKRRRGSFSGEPFGGLDLFVASGALFIPVGKPRLLFMPGGGEPR
jgi:hypothetical protein